MNEKIRQHRTIVAAVLIACLAFTFRLSYINHTKVYGPIRGDARYYYIYANNLLFHGTFSKETSQNPTPDSYWAPGYPTFLASVLLLSGDQLFYPATLFTQAIMGSIIAALVVVVGSLVMPLWAASVAGILTACSPHLISLGGYVLTETLFSLSIMVFLYLYFRAARTEKSSHFISAGAAAGISYLINPVIFFAPLLLSGFRLLNRKAGQQSAGLQNKKAIVLFLAVFLGICSLWSVRGYLSVPAASTSSSSRALLNFIIGTHPDFFEIWRADPRDPNNPVEIDKRKVNGSWSKFMSIFADRLSEQPVRFAEWFLYQKPKLLWSWDILIGVGDVYVYPVTTTWFATSRLGSAIHSGMKTIHWWLFLASLAGILFLKRFWGQSRGIVIISIYITVIYVSAVYVILQSEPRYSIPLRPLMYICAVFGLRQVGIAVRNRFTEE